MPTRGSLIFNGSTSWAHDGGGADWFLTTTYTIEFFSRAANISDSTPQAILCQDPDQDSIDVFYHNGNLKIRNGEAYCPEPISNRWTHVAIVADVSDLKIFYDGVEQPVTGALGGHPSSLTELAIGRRGYTNDFQYFSGSLANIRIVKEAAIYSSSFDPCAIDIEVPITGSVLVMPIYETDPLVDISDYAHTFTNNNIAWNDLRPCFEPTPTPTPTPTETPQPTDTPTPTPTTTPQPTDTPTPTPTPTPTTRLFDIGPALQGDLDFYLGVETISPNNFRFEYGDAVWLNASQNKYSFDYYEIYAPVTVLNSSYCFISCYGFTASFDPRTQVQLNTASDIIGNKSLIIARYRA